VIGKATPTATLAVSNSPQTYTGSGQQRQLLFLQVQQGSFNIPYRRTAQLKLMQQLCGYSQLRSNGLTNYNKPSCEFQQGL
jgi:hypothetical protein